MAPSKLSKCLITPSRLTSILNWNRNSGSIMSVEVSNERIAVAITGHPGKKYQEIRVLDPIPYQRNEDCERRKYFILKELKRIARSEEVCGFLVGWPLEPSGSPGSRCGRVLHLLDYLTEERDEGCFLINSSRPIVLWDERKFTHKQFDEKKNPEDSWGRSQSYAQIPHSLKKEDIESNKYTYNTTLREDHPTSRDSTISSLILRQFLNQQFSTTDESDIYTSDEWDENESYQIIRDQIDRNCSNFESSIL
mmetsp:Transcript_14045/g.15864  ORF Transcript_14045/g.15864 Transcript_14045/m.15864 type:complete len:251 (+) Transcript_14045:156-908(+)